MPFSRTADGLSALSHEPDNPRVIVGRKPGANLVYNPVKAA